MSRCPRPRLLLQQRCTVRHRLQPVGVDPVCAGVQVSRPNVPHRCHRLRSLRCEAGGRGGGCWRAASRREARALTRRSRARGGGARPRGAEGRGRG